MLQSSRDNGFHSHSVCSQTELTKGNDVVSRKEPLVSPAIYIYALRYLFGVLTLLGPCFGQSLVNLATQGRNVDFSNFSFTRPLTVLTTSPATCQIGQVYFNSSAVPGANLFGCTATNVWSQFGPNYTFSAPLSLSGTTLSLPKATSAIDGYLSHLDWNAFSSKQPAGNYLTGLTGDITAAGPGASVATLATVNSASGQCGDSTHVCQITSNSKGLVTSQTAVGIAGGGSLAVQNNGTAQGTASTINFATNMTATVSGGVATVSSSGTGGGAQSSTQLTDFATTFTPATATIAAGTWGIGTATYSLPGITATVNSLSVSGASNSSPITLTVSSTNGLHNGDTVMVSGVNGNTAANGTWAVVVDNGTQIDLQGSTGNGTYSSGGIVAGSGNGVAYIEANDSGSIDIYHSSSAALILTCTGSCVTNQVASPAFDPDASPIAVLTISAGAITTVTDKRRFMNSRGITAGLGIAVTDTGGSASIAVDATVARATGSNIFTGSNTFTGGYILVPAGSQPACSAANEGWFWYAKGSGTANGSFQICQNQSGSYLWVTH